MPMGIMRNVAGKLHEAVAQVAPVVGVSLGKEDDKSTWTITFAEDATKEQMDAAQVIVDAFDEKAVVPDVPQMDRIEADVATTKARLEAAEAELAKIKADVSALKGM